VGLFTSEKIVRQTSQNEGTRLKNEMRTTTASAAKRQMQNGKTPRLKGARPEKDEMRG